jgi:hypothetical protein
VIAAVLTAASVAVLAYAGDYAVFRYRLSANRQPFGQVTVITYYAVGEKGNKVEYIFNPPQAVTCVSSLFPHAGYTPCWYLERHKEQRTDI